MYGRNFAGRGQRGSMGLGLRGSSPPWPYVGRGRGGLPRCSYYFGGTPVPPYQPLARTQAEYRHFSAPMSKEEELGYLKNQAEAVKSKLDEIESRMRDIEAKK
jgi:hypothetical protein